VAERDRWSMTQMLEPMAREARAAPELAAFVATVRGQRAPDRSLDHELLVEETLHRAVGTLPV
jgi:hypothetical protein